MSGPKVSVITAVYNGERHLGAALESLFAQDYHPFESIVVDDGSEDRTAEIVQRFPVVYIRQENQGPGAARNAGLAVASGELVTFLDSDDVLPPTKLAVQAAYLVDHPEVACVLGRQEILLEPGVEPPPWLTRDLLYGELGGIPLLSAMIRRQALVELGGFDPDPRYRYTEDRDLFVRMGERGFRYAVLPDLVLHRRCDGSNMYFRELQGSHPFLRSLKAKIERSRRAAEAERP